MKKIFSIVIASLLLVLIAGCTDQKYRDDTVSVIFFTGGIDSNATEIETLLNVEPGSLIEQPSDPQRPGYSFEGWFADAQSTIPWDFATDRVGNVSIVIYAKWEPLTHTIEYELNGGYFANPDAVVRTFQTGFTIVILPTPIRDGYTFVNWFFWELNESTGLREKVGTGFKSIPTGTMRDIYLYAEWSQIITRVSFITNLPTGEGPITTPSPINVANGSIIDFPVLDDLENYTFVGWNTNATGTGAFFVNGEIFTRTVAGLNVYAIWEPK